MSIDNFISQAFVSCNVVCPGCHCIMYHLLNNGSVLECRSPSFARGGKLYLAPVVELRPLNESESAKARELSISQKAEGQHD